ncbi:MAG TPA: tetratricopeptide repeat protein [Terriglobales bacterium]
MSSRCRWLGYVTAAIAFCTTVSGQQTPSILGVVHKVGGLPVSHVEVRIEGAGAAETKDSGEFALPMTANLHVGMAAVFHVKDWIILKPCELKSGRAYLRDPSAEPMELLVLARGDPRLTSAKRDVSIIGCLLEEEASQFTPKPKSAGGPRSALPKDSDPVFPREAETIYAEAVLKSPPTTPGYHLLQAAYRPPAPQGPSAPPTEKPSDAADAARDEFLATKAKELGLSVEELKSAINSWGKSVEDPYDKGLAAVQELRYADAARYIAASIPSPPGPYITRYVLLARAEYEQAHYAAAESALRKVLAVHSDDPVVLNNLALALDAQAKYSEAEPLYKRSLAIEEKALGPDHPEVAIRLNNLGLLYYDQGKYSAAELLYKRSLAIREKSLGPDHPSVATQLNNLGLLYKTQGKYSEAEPLYKRALAIDEKALGPDHSSVAIGLNNLGLLYKTQGKYSEAEPLYKRALAIDEKALGPDHPDVARDLNNLGMLNSAQGKYSEAEPLYKWALAIDEKALGPNHTSVATIDENLAVTLRKLGRDSEAEAYEQQAAKIRAKQKQN